MRNSEFNLMVKELSKLTPRQKEEFLAILVPPEPKADPEVNLVIKSPTKCPSCHSESIQTWGHRYDLARFRCKSCKRTFNAVTGTPFAELHLKEKWELYARCLLESKSIRACAKECGISIPTSFLWRHRFLALIDQNKPPALEGIVEMDDTLFLDSKKGDRHLGRPARKRGGKARRPGRSKEQVCVLVARDRTGRTTDFILPRFDAQAVDEVLGSIIAGDSLLCTDSSKIFASFAERRNLLHGAINVRDGEHIVLKTVHVQNVNAYHNRLKEWMIRFHGVSTKWLSRYLGWWRMMDCRQSELTPSEILKYAVA